MVPISDKQLISQLKSRDRNALKDVYMDYKSEFFRFAYRYQANNDILEDIFQDALIALYENAQMGKLDNLKSSVKTYLFGIGKFMIFKKFRDTKEITTDENYVFDTGEYEIINDVLEASEPLKKNAKLSLTLKNWETSAEKFWSCSTSRDLKLKK